MYRDVPSSSKADISNIKPFVPSVALSASQVSFSRFESSSNGSHTNYSFLPLYVVVTSFRPKNPLIRDDTVLTTVRPISNLSELYSQFSEYRLEMLEERIRAELKEIRESRAAGRGVSTKKLKAFLEEQQRFLEHMNVEMVDDEMVKPGDIDDSHLLTKKKAAVRPAKRPRPGDDL